MPNRTPVPGPPVIEAPCDGGRHALFYDWLDALLGDAAAVLDAPCGTGEGSWRLATRTGRTVVGVDRALGACRATGRGTVTFETATPNALPFADDRFTAVVSAEAWWADGGLDTFVAEAVRVLDADGLLVVQLGPGTDSAALHATLREHFTSIASVAVQTGTARWIGASPGHRAELARSGIAAHAEADGHILVATSGAAPVLPVTMALTPTPDIQAAAAQRLALDEIIAEQRSVITQLQRRHDLAQELRARVLEAEQLIADLPQLREKLVRLTDELELRTAEAAEWEALARDRGTQIDELRASTSWRVTQPMRRLKDQISR